MKKLNFGCGNKILEGFLNVDIQKRKDIDLSFDFDKFPYPLKENEFDYVLCDNVLEHLKDPNKVMIELSRILKRCGKLKLVVPYYNSHTAFNDITHRHFFNKRAIYNLISPNYQQQKEPIWEIENIKLLPSPIGRVVPTFIREYISWIFGWIINKIEVDFVNVKKK